MNDTPPARMHGFRVSALDGAILLLGAFLTLWLRNESFPLWWLVPMVLGHFFLFCNVFLVWRRLGQKQKSKRCQAFNPSIRRLHQGFVSCAPLLPNPPSCGLMKSLLHFLPLLAALTVVASDPPIRTSTRWLGDRVAMQKRITATIESYATELRIIGDGLRAAQATTNGEQKAVIDASLQSLDAIMERQDVSGASGLLPLVNLLHAHNTDESPRILSTIDNASAQGTLNYLIDGIFNARMMGSADTVSEHEIEAMLQFYAGNPAQTSEGSWQTNNTMLFVFGDRVLHTLVKKIPDRVDAFYKAVQDARRSAQSGPGPDEEVIPDAERPNTEQLQAYEASFGKLVELATKGALPNSDTTSQTTSTQASVIPTNVPAVPPAPKKTPSTAPAASTPSEEPTSSTPWSLIVVLIVAASGLLWLLVKKRK